MFTKITDVYFQIRELQSMCQETLATYFKKRRHLFGNGHTLNFRHSCCVATTDIKVIKYKMWAQGKNRGTSDKSVQINS
jgi:hypothetical protein